MPTLEVVKAIAKEPLEFHPGEDYRYGLNHDVLGALIEVWSGMSFGEYMKKNIFDPCGMKQTGYQVTQEIKAKIPPEYHGGKEGPETYWKQESYCRYMLGEDSEYESGGAGIISCVEDYIELADALANGGISPKTGAYILNARTIDMMRINQLTEEQLVKEYSKAENGYGYGLGVRTLMTNARGTLSNLGEFGWDGAAGSYFMVDPNEQLAVFMAKNLHSCYNNGDPIMITNALYTDLHK